MYAGQVEEMRASTYIRGCYAATTRIHPDEHSCSEQPRYGRPSFVELAGCLGTSFVISAAYAVVSLSGPRPTMSLQSYANNVAS
ncbi:uncharacterized protein SPSK_05666 [Sporothrix schenckii 1099-18]|uniref:Uncharacterized protein n=1 Tax=Sporothrix schenckii 1099-18 TaxID=1397361 RepID=A0A0F2LTG5_SPOSC|nr:uncharacterized protein SPSK_05666 [Sporothrix schenckii 1099-18]KJR80772.1 hypothetical protein SPSK_05666 [Sporothrix schenckii 1099-18]